MEWYGQLHAGQVELAGCSRRWVKIYSALKTIRSTVGAMIVAGLPSEPAGAGFRRIAAPGTTASDLCRQAATSLMQYVYTVRDVTATGSSPRPRTICRAMPGVLHAALWPARNRCHR